MKRKIGLSLIFAAALPLVAASAAWACGVLATLKLDTKVASPGQAVTATGRNYGTSNVSEVSIRLKSRTGQVVSTVTPVAGGAISKTFTLPQGMDPGWYVVLATQTTLTTGTPKSGTPGRTTVRIQGSAKDAAAGSAWTSPPAGPSSGSSFASALGSVPMLLAIALSLTMLAGGWMLVTRTSRSASRSPLGI